MIQLRKYSFGTDDRGSFKVALDLLRNLFQWGYNKHAPVTSKWQLRAGSD